MWVYRAPYQPNIMAAIVRMCEKYRKVLTSDKRTLSDVYGTTSETPRFCRTRQNALEPGDHGTREPRFPYKGSRGQHEEEGAKIDHQEICCQENGRGKSSDPTRAAEAVRLAARL